FRRRVPASRAGAWGHRGIAHQARHAVVPYPITTDEEEQLMDALVAPDIGDVLDVFRSGVPARGGGAGGHGGVARRAWHVGVPQPIAADEEEQFVNAWVGPDIGDVLDIFRSSVPARGAGEGGGGVDHCRARHAVVPYPVTTDKEEQLMDALVVPDIGNVLDVFRSGVPARRTRT